MEINKLDKKIELDIVIYPEGYGDKKIYSISSVQFPNVVTQGSTIDKAKQRLREALELYFDCAPSEKKRLLLFKKEECENNAPMISRIFL